MQSWNETSGFEMFGYASNSTPIPTQEGAPMPIPSGDFLTRDQYYDALKVSLALSVPICIGGIISNFLSIRTFLRMGLEDCMTIVFFNLSVADLVVVSGHLVSVIPSVLFIVQLETGLFFAVPPFDLSVIIITFTKTFSFATKLLTTFLALQRALCVTIPLHFKGVFTRFRTFIITGILWIYCLACGILLLFQYKFIKIPGVNGTRSYYVMNRDHAAFYFYILQVIIIIFNGIFVNLASLVIVFVSVVAVKYVLVRSVRFRKENLKPKSTGDEKGQVTSDQSNAPEKSVEAKDNLSGAKEKQAILQVLVVSIVFLVTSTPHIINIVLEMAVPIKFGIYMQYHYTYATYYAYRLVFEQLNSAVNIFIYYKYNTKFRQLCFKKKV